jgi:hypothetical protein
MNYPVNMGSDAMIYLPNFIKICLSIEKLLSEYVDRHTDSMVIP